MKQHDLAKLEGQIKELRGSLVRLAEDRDLEELLKIIHRHGWTTPAEYVLVTGLVGSMQTLADALVGHRQVLMTGSRAVGAGQALNPQPLPPKEAAAHVASG